MNDLRVFSRNLREVERLRYCSMRKPVGTSSWNLQQYVLAHRDLALNSQSMEIKPLIRRV
jgi:hypothetical protein